MIRTVLMLAGLLAAAIPASAQYQIAELGTLGGPSGSATAINEHGQIVGWANTAEACYVDWQGKTWCRVHAFLWQEGVMTDLGTADGDYSIASSINEGGQVIGSVRNTGEGWERAFLWENGVMTNLGTLGGLQSSASAINEIGQIVGWADAVDGFRSAFLWQEGTMTDLGSLGGVGSSASGIDEAGRIVGTAAAIFGAADWVYHAFLWQDGVMTDLGTLDGLYSDSEAYSINPPGQIVGRAQTANYDRHAFLWQDGVMTDLGTLGGKSSEAYAMNGAGQIVGMATTAANKWHAFVSQDGVMTDLGTLGGTYTKANAINEAGQIVGYAETADTYTDEWGGVHHVTHAFVWQDGTMIALPTLGGPENYANAINEAGQIVGMATTAEGVLRAVLWSPLPVITPPVITSLEASAERGIRVAFTATPPTSTTVYDLETADGAGGPWKVVLEAELTELETGRYQFTLPFDIARAAAFWRVIETVDTDGDGISDGIDGCPLDPLKTEPGACGCGVADTDTDEDTVPDCNDLCPGHDDRVDENGNGTPDGCEVAVDTDGDGTPDENDGCPLDPLKIDPGVCGCGVAETDTDGDAVPDCTDSCPQDPLKTEAGVCGCGVPDTDTDDDTVPDCNDVCPGHDDRIDENRNGTPDGCEVAVDTDGDGTPDENDGCPLDPLKIDSGACGCGVADTDSDGDTVADCNDLCPGFDDRIDENGNGTPDDCELAGMARIGGGPFDMGDTFSESGELPVHSVPVSTFYLDKYEVTKALWDEVYAWATAHGYSFANPGAGTASSHPVHTVSWYDVVKWCNARSEKEGLVPCYYTSLQQTTVYRVGQLAVANDWVNWSANGYRLPTEAEWEKAARGGLAGKRYPWGDDIDPTRANYYLGGMALKPVGGYAPNGYGLYDMAGNVWEWCWDWWDFTWYANAGASAADPRGPNSGEIRVHRGGSWPDYPMDLRCATRGGVFPPSSGFFCVGFRCARGQR